MHVFALWSSCNYGGSFDFMGVYAREEDAVAEAMAIVKEEESKGYTFLFDDEGGPYPIDAHAGELRVRVAPLYVRGS